jgi:large subunit ribosomal protein L21
MKYAIVATGGKQYKVTEGSTLEIDKVLSDPGQDILLDKILLYVDEGVVQVGQPNLDTISVTAKVLEQTKGKKIRVMKFKAKSRYRRATGHRQLLTKIQIEKIEKGS